MAGDAAVSPSSAVESCLRKAEGGRDAAEGAAASGATAAIAGAGEAITGSPGAGAAGRGIGAKNCDDGGTNLGLERLAKPAAAMSSAAVVLGIACTNGGLAIQGPGFAVLLLLL